MKIISNRLRRTIATSIVLSFLIVPLGAFSTAYAAVANTITYQGRLLSSPTEPAANLNFDMRFSLWADADFVDGVDRDGVGALVGTAWQEVLPMTTDSQGFFIVDVGSVTALPEFSSDLYRYMQAEVKVSGAADTAYYVLDNKAADPVIDRKSLENSAYAQNALRLEGRQLGFSAENIPYLDAEGKLDRNLITDDSWLDPVADAAAMGNISSPEAGDVVFVISEGRLYSFSGTQWVVVVDETDQAVSSLESRMDSAETNITSLGAQISSNDTDIAANLAAIQSNDTDIVALDTRVTTNEGDIASNDTDIAANLAAIQSNDTDIAANLAAIQSNDTDIAQNAADIVANLAASDWKEAVATVAALSTTYPTAEAGWSVYVTGESEIYSYNGTAWVKVGADNLAAIQSNDTDISALDTRLTTAETDIVTNATNISSNDTDIAANLAAIQSNDTDIATNAADISSNDTDIAANLAAIQSNDTDIATNATNMTTNAGAIAQNASDISSNDTDIATNATAIASNDTDIAQNVTDITSNDTDIAQNVTDISDNATEINDIKTFSSANFDVFILP